MSNVERNTGEPIKLTPDMAGQMLRDGGLTRAIAPFTPPLPDVEATIGDPMIETARQLFGKDFLGPNAIKVMEQKCQLAGIDVTFEIPCTPISHKKQDLIDAKKDEQTGRARFMTLRPLKMVHNGEIKDVTIRNLVVLFKDINPFGSGRIFRETTVDDVEQGDIGVCADLVASIGYEMPTKNIVPESDTNTISLGDKYNYLKRGEIGRLAIETVLDLIIYYANTGTKLLVDRYDAGISTSTTDADAGRLVVGMFGERGIGILEFELETKSGSIGLCSAK